MSLNEEPNIYTDVPYMGVASMVAALVSVGLTLYINNSQMAFSLWASLGFFALTSIPCLILVFDECKSNITAIALGVFWGACLSPIFSYFTIQ
jgi:hypothetical protein